MPDKFLASADRRATDIFERMTDAEFRGFITRRMNEQDKRLDEILLFLKFGKLGADLLKWTIAIGAGLAAIWTAARGFKG